MPSPAVTCLYSFAYRNIIGQDDHQFKFRLLACLVIHPQLTLREINPVAIPRLSGGSGLPGGTDFFSDGGLRV